MSVNCIRSLGGKEDCGTSQFVRVEPATGGSLGTDKGVKWMTAAVWLTLTEGSGLRGSDIARTDGIALNVIPSIL